jgi:hypothetical protein
MSTDTKENSMTDQELDAIDAEVARHIIGFGDRVKRYAGSSRWHIGDAFPVAVRQYSRDWSAMGEVVEKMRADGYGWSFESMNNLQYRAEFAPGNYGTDAEEYRSIQDSLPLAVALAALAAVGKPWSPKP